MLHQPPMVTDASAGPQIPQNIGLAAKRCQAAQAARRMYLTIRFCSDPANPTELGPLPWGQGGEGGRNFPSQLVCLLATSLAWDNAARAERLG